MLEIEAAIVSEAYKFYKRELALTARSLGLKTSEVKYFLRWSRIFRAKKKSGKKKSAISFERAPVGRLRIGRPLRDQGK